MIGMLQYAAHTRRLQQKLYQPLSEELGLSQLEMELLLFLRNNPDRNTAHDAVTLRGFAKSNVSKAVEVLERKGYIQVQPDASSRRVKRLTLLPGRRQECDRIAQQQKRCFAAILEGFTEEERDALARYFVRMDGNVVRTLETLEDQ